MARFRDPRRANRNDGFGDIPYADLAQRLLQEPEQRIVPLLGAGASRPVSKGVPDTASPIDPSLLAELAAKLQIKTEDAQLFLEIALAITARLNIPLPTPTTPQSTYEAVRTSVSAPSAAELAQALAERSAYDYFATAKRRINDLTARSDWDDAKLTRLIASLARLTGIGSPTPPLLDASSYHSYRKPRNEFWLDLYRIFENKTQPTETHRLVASAAGNYVQANRHDATAPDWLVITTNYDCLLENALDSAAEPVPYYVVTVLTTDPPTVDLRFSKGAQQYLALNDTQFKKIAQSAFVEPDYAVAKAPGNFSGLTNRPKPLVTIYKIHGSLHAGATSDRDGVVITHEDYVTFLSVDGIVPGYIRTRLRGMHLLLLGYSFSDWNVRSLYRSITQYRASRAAKNMMVGDYAVLYEPSAYETGFFDTNKIDVLDTSLDVFCQRIQEVSGH
jgi:hypothetical protein